MTIDQALAGAVSFFKDPETALQNYHEFGFHLEKNLVDPLNCELLIKESYTLSGAKAKDYKPFMMPHRENSYFMEALKHKKIVDIISMLVGGKPVGLQSQFFYCKPGTRGFSLHQDNFFVQAKFDVFASAWMALTNTQPLNGGLIVYPGSHKNGLFPVKKLNLGADPNQDPNANNEESDVPPHYQPYNLTVLKGSVLFIHGHTVHGSNPNKSDENRYVLLNTYIKSGESFRSGNYAQREAVEVV